MFKLSKCILTEHFKLRIKVILLYNELTKNVHMYSKNTYVSPSHCQRVARKRGECAREGPSSCAETNTARERSLSLSPPPFPRHSNRQ